MFSQKIRFFMATKMLNTSRRLVIPPQSTPVNPMTTRGGNRFQGHPNYPRNWGPRIGRGPRRRGNQGYQAQPGYYSQYGQSAPVRAPSHFRGRGGNQSTNYHGNRQWQNVQRLNISNAPPPSGGAMQTPTTPRPTPAISSPVAPNSTEGGSLFGKYMNKEVYSLMYKERQRIRRTAGSKVQCAKEPCTEMLDTGPKCKYCIECGANQDNEETRHLRETLDKLKS